MISASHFYCKCPAHRPPRASYQANRGLATRSRSSNTLKRETNIVDFTYPHGNCCVDSVPACPVILIAAATGVTQMRSIARWLLAQPEAPTVSLFWGTLTPEELYLSNELDSLAASDHRFQYFPVVSQGGSAWSGRKGLVVNAAIETAKTYLVPTFIYPAVQPWFMGPLTAS